MSGVSATPSLRLKAVAAMIDWLIYAVTFAVAATIPLVAGPDEPSTTTASASLTMTFVVMGLGTVFNALTNRRDPTTGLAAPVLKAAGIAALPLALVFVATELPGLQQGLLTQELTGLQWLAAIGLAALLPLVIEGDKWLRRRRFAPPAAGSAQEAVSPVRARTAQPVSPRPSLSGRGRRQA